MNAEQLAAQAARLEGAVADAIDKINADEELSSGLVCAVLAKIIVRVSYWSAQVHAGVEDA